MQTSNHKTKTTRKQQEQEPLRSGDLLDHVVESRLHLARQNTRGLQLLKRIAAGLDKDQRECLVAAIAINQPSLPCLAAQWGAEKVD